MAEAAYERLGHARGAGLLQKLRRLPQLRVADDARQGPDRRGWGGGGCLWIILLIILLCCCCGNGGSRGCGNGCGRDNNCGCDDNCCC